MMLAFFGTGAWGIILGLYMGSLPYSTSTDGTNYFMITLLGVVNISVGAIVGVILLLQEPKHSNLKKRKKEKKD